MTRGRFIVRVRKFKYVRNGNGGIVHYKIVIVNFLLSIVSIFLPDFAFLRGILRAGQTAVAVFPTTHMHISL
jgi:hypothetical protein